VNLDKAHHYQQWATTLSLLRYDERSGSGEVEATLFFKQWNQESRSRVWSYSEGGRAEMQAELVLVQLKNGRVEDQEVDGTVAWKANGKAADPANSLATHFVSLR